jgi:oligosaccharide repeat unit polymerase
MTIIYAIILVCCFFGTFLYDRDIFSPARAYILIYLALLLVNSFHLSTLQTPWSFTTHAFFWGASLMFIGGVSIAGIMDSIKHNGTSLKIDAAKSWLAQDAESVDWDWFYWTWIVIAGLFLIIFAYGVFTTGSMPVFAKDPEKARIVFLGPLISGIGWFFGPLSLMLVVEYFLFYKPVGRKKIFCITVSIVVLFLYLTLVTRLDLFRFAIFAIVLYHYGVNKLKMKQFLILACIGFVFFIGFFLLRVHSETISTITQMLKIHMPKKLMWLTGAYSYVACNFWNLNYGFTKFVDGNYSYPQSWGFELFRPVFFLFRLEGAMQNAYGFDGIYNESINMVQGLNTSIYMWHFYKDFGTVGVFLIPLVFGFLIAIFYHNTMRRPTLFRLSLWGILIGMVLFSFTAVLWSFWFTWMNILVLIIAHRKIGLIGEKHFNRL